MTASPPASVADELLARLPASPDAYPQKVDLVRSAVLLVRFDPAAYRAASFLDDRILSPATQGAWAGIGAVAEAARQVAVRRPLHFIFHTGHVGSTLLSRLLDEVGGVLGLREPLPLRTLAEAQDVLGRPESLLGEPQFAAALDAFLALWSRGYADTRCVVLKATSSGGRLASALLGRSSSSKAVYLNLKPEPYLATLLAGQNSPLDLRGHGPERMRRLCARTTAALPALHALSLGELAALSWLTESWSRHEALARFPDRVLAVDFDAFLGAVDGHMGSVLGHLGLPQDAPLLQRLAQSAVLTRYSKAPEHAYTPAVRAQALGESRRRHAEEIRKGLAWLECVAAADAAAAAVISARD